MEYVVIETGGKQYKVAPGTVISVDNLNVESGEFSFDRVLLHVNDAAINIGKPYIDGMVVKATIVENFKGEKVRVAKFLAKSRYRKVRGFRAQLSKVKIGDIISKKSSASVKSAPKKTEEETAVK